MEAEPFYGLPKEVKFCRRCVISNQRPSSTVEFKNTNKKKETIAFDDDGVCMTCKWFEDVKEKNDWKKREEELKSLCDKYRSNDGSYDCIVPGSGGKDSCFVAHILKYKYGMHPLTVTWSPHLYTDIGWKNFQNWIHVGGFDNILVTPNGKVHRLLTKLAFQNLLHPFQPFIVGQKYIGPRMALKHKVPLVFYGENQAENGNNVEDNQKPTMNPDFFSSDKIDLSTIFLGGISAKELIEKYGLTLNDLELYLPVSKKEIENLGLQFHYMSYYLKWDPQENFYYASKNCGFRPNSERTEGSYSKYSSIDDKTDPFHYYTTLLKFGIGRATYDAAQEIRHKKITREEGVALVIKYDDEFPSKYFQEFLGYIEITETEFWEIIEKFRSPHLWEKVDGKWELKQQVSNLDEEEGTK